MDFEMVHKELAKPNVTLTLLHDEYVREAKNVEYGDGFRPLVRNFRPVNAE